jgi:hypothetical protein
MERLNAVSGLPCTLLEKPSVTQDHNTRVTENSVTHIDREAQSLVLTDFSDCSTWMMKFSVTLVFWSCVMLSFFNSVGSQHYTDCSGSGVDIRSRLSPPHVLSLYNDGSTSCTYRSTVCIIQLHAPVPPILFFFLLLWTPTFFRDQSLLNRFEKSTCCLFAKPLQMSNFCATMSFRRNTLVFSALWPLSHPPTLWHKKNVDTV